ncbi:MAG: DUF1559 domain-containing protein [Maioricimonas sp. JB049]
MHKHTPHIVRSGRACRRAFTLVELLVAIAIIGILLALLLPAVQQVRASARRTQCRNHLRQIGLAFHNHESQYGRFPSNGWGFLWVGDPDRGTDEKQPGGWIYNLLPFVEQSALRDMGKGQTGTDRTAALGDLTEQPLPLFKCPARPAPQKGLHNPMLPPNNAEWRVIVARTDYAVNEGDFITDTLMGPSTLEEGDSGRYAWRDTTNATGISYQRSRVRFADIRDGASNTYLAGEKYVSRLHYQDEGDPGYDQSMYGGVDLDLNRWTIAPPEPDGEPVGIDPARQFGSAHRDGCHFVMCDGSVRQVSYSIDAEVHRSLGNRRDGLPLGGQP